jgi:hypothetical protein
LYGLTVAHIIEGDLEESKENSTSLEGSSMMGPKSCPDELSCKLDGISDIVKGRTDLVDEAISVFQPFPPDFQTYVEELVFSIETLRSDIDNAETKDDEMELKTELNNLMSRLNEVKSGQIDTEIGGIMQREMACVSYKGERHAADWSLIDLGCSRKPLRKTWKSTTLRGFLGTLRWLPVSKFGQLQPDLYVRKDGATTGVTFGVIGGLCAGVKHTAAGFRQLCREYCAVREEKPRKWYFAQKGDSGASVTNHKGEVVGMVYAGYELGDVRMVLDRLGRVNIPHMKKNRMNDGTFNWVRFVTSQVTGGTFTIIESAEMIMERCVLKVDIFPDC